MGLLDNIFATQTPEYITSLLGEDAANKLKQQSLMSGLVNTAVGYLAAPKNQNLGLGRILAGAYQQGMQGAQGTYDKATQDYIQGIKMQELKKSIETKKKIDELAPNLFTQATPAQYASQNVYGASQPMLDETGQPIAPNLNPQVVDTKQVMTAPQGKPEINYDTLQKMLGVDVGAAAPYITGASTLKSLMTPIKEQLTVVPEGGRVIDAAGKVIAEGMPKEKSVTDSADRYAIQSFGVPFKDLTQAQATIVNKQVIEEKKASATTINMPPPAKVILDVDKDTLTSLVSSTNSARSIANYTRNIDAAIGNAGGSGAIKLSADIQNYLGIKTPDANVNQLVNAIATKGATEIRTPGSGSTSDLEFGAYKDTFPTLATSKEGRMLMVKIATANANRNAKLADWARKNISAGTFSYEGLGAYDDSLGQAVSADIKKQVESLVAKPNANMDNPNQVLFNQADAIINKRD